VRIGVVNNLRAGLSRRGVSRLLKILRRHPEILHIETESARALPEALGEFAREQIDLLVLNGGDGTLQHALTEILSNGESDKISWIAPDLGVRRDPIAALEHLLRAAADGSLHEMCVERPVLRLSSSRGGPAQYGMFFGAGMISRAIDLTHRIFPTGRSQGVFGASIVTASLIAKTLTRPTQGILTPDKIQILIDGRPVPEGEFYLAIASSLKRLILGINPFWGREPGDVRFTALASRVRRLGRAVPGILRGKPGARVSAENGYTSANADRVELRLDCGFTVDGEIFPCQADERVTITADRRVTFVRA
jgi:hypothetical protein